METDYISREAAIKKFEDAEYLYDPEPGAKRYTVEDAKEILNDVPAADVRPVKEGHWVPVTNGRGGHECDQCHDYAPSYPTGEERLSDFCPNCGAKMGGTP